MEEKYMMAIISAILSFIIPGLGQVINGDIKKGIILFVLALIMGIIAGWIFRTWIVYIIDLFIALYAAYDAYITAQ
jgi:TM2 domain-containing membrane protein YozV